MANGRVSHGAGEVWDKFVMDGLRGVRVEAVVIRKSSATVTKATAHDLLFTQKDPFRNVVNQMTAGLSFPLGSVLRAPR